MDRSTVDKVMEMMDGTTEEAQRRREALWEMLTDELTSGPLSRFNSRDVRAAVEELLSRANGNQVWAAYADRRGATPPDDPLADLEMDKDDWAERANQLEREVRETTEAVRRVQVPPEYRFVRALYYGRECMAHFDHEHECLDDMRELYRTVSGSDTLVSREQYAKQVSSDD